MQAKIKRGAAGEAQAAAYLEAKGFRVRVRNYRHKRGEIDLIAEKENWLVFVEVKTRSSVAFGFPEQFVDSRKQRKIFETAAQYLLETNWPGPVRYDVVAVTLNPRVSIHHFEDAFY
jgi:putative endonuclease